MWELHQTRDVLHLKHFITDILVSHVSVHVSESFTKSISINPAHVLWGFGFISVSQKMRDSGDKNYLNGSFTPQGAEPKKCCYYVKSFKLKLDEKQNRRVCAGRIILDSVTLHLASSCTGFADESSFQEE